MLTNTEPFPEPVPVPARARPGGGGAVVDAGVERYDDEDDGGGNGAAVPDSVDWDWAAEFLLLGNR